MAKSKVKGREERREWANERQAVADKRSPREQLARLDKMFGEGKGAAKERDKLHKRLADGQVGKEQQQ